MSALWLPHMGSLHIPNVWIDITVNFNCVMHINTNYTYCVLAQFNNIFCLGKLFSAINLSQLIFSYCLDHIQHTHWNSNDLHTIAHSFEVFQLWIYQPWQKSKHTWKQCWVIKVFFFHFLYPISLGVVIGKWKYRSRDIAFTDYLRHSKVTARRKVVTSGSVCFLSCAASRQLAYTSEWYVFC